MLQYGGSLCYSNSMEGVCVTVTVWRESVLQYGGSLCYNTEGVCITVTVWRESVLQ